MYSMKSILFAAASFLIPGMALADCGAPDVTQDQVIINLLPDATTGQSAFGVIQALPAGSEVKRGVLLFDNTLNDFVVCDGTNWVSITQSGGGSGGGQQYSEVVWGGTHRQESRSAGNDIKWPWQSTDFAWDNTSDYYLFEISVTVQPRGGYSQCNDYGASYSGRCGYLVTQCNVELMHDTTYKRIGPDHSVVPNGGTSWKYVTDGSYTSSTPNGVDGVVQTDPVWYWQMGRKSGPAGLSPSRDVWCDYNIKIRRYYNQ